MYDELVKVLRKYSCPKYSDGCGMCPSFKFGCAIRAIQQAADAIEKLQNKLSLSDETGRALCHTAHKLLDEVPRWIPVTERLPENDVHVLLSCKCGAGAYVCDGFHTEKYSTPTQFYEDIDADYDEETDEYYFPEGWWEVIKNWDDYSCVAIEDTVTHWTPLPQPPKEETIS